MTSRMSFRVLAILPLLFMTLLSYSQRGSTDANDPQPTSGTTTPVDGTHNFEIFINKSRVGEYSVTRAQQGDLETYKASSLVRVRFMGQIEVGYELDCAFKDGVLQSSECTTFKNGKVRDKTVVSKQGNAYTIDESGKSRNIEREIERTLIQLYFEEPSEGMVAMVEVDGAFKNVTSEGNGVYRLAEAGKSRGSILTYSNGLLQSVRVPYPIVNFSVVRP